MTPERPAAAPTTPGSGTGRADDPVLAKRRTLATVAVWGKRLGYLALLVAIVAFVVGAGFLQLAQWTVWLTVGGLVAATVLLVPAIILGYAVAKAEREDPGRG